MKASDIIKDISQEVEKMCEVVSSNHSLKQDLSQEVLLSLLEKGEEDLNDLHDRGKLLGYAFRIAYLKWNSNNGVPVGGVNNSNFKAVYRDYDYINCVELDDVLHYSTEEAVNAQDQVNDLLRKLTTLERRVLQEYLDVNLKITNFANNSGISRSNLKVRLDAIFDKIRNDRD